MPIKKITEIPGPKSKELMSRRKRAVARGPFHTTSIFVKAAHGAILTDADGNELIDFSSGIGVVNIGHTNDRVVKAIKDQSEKLIHGSFNVTPYENYVALCEKLNQAAPGNFEKKSFLANSGAEAVENAIKIARTFTGRNPIVCFEHGFHGRTYMAMALTYKEKPYRAGFGVNLDGILRAPFPYGYRWPGGGDDKKVSEECFKKFEEVIQKSPELPAAVLIEPVLGEGGFIAAPPDFLKRVQEFCRSKKIVFIADEIQSGFGRTGAIYASLGLGITPDLILSAKGLGGGMPISAVTGKSEIMDAPSDGGIGGTFGGNPVACAAALAVFEAIEKDGILEMAQKLGETLRAKLNSFKEKFSIIGEVRGLGPMQAIELVKDQKTKEADPENTKKLMTYCHERGVVIMSAGSYGNVIRFLIPLVISKNDLEEGLAVVEKGLEEISK
jgi:4-aminobutyrate aminotransferase/(S)-3-amino-2-methylpropionate transaminase